MGHPAPVSAEPVGRFFDTYPQGNGFSSPKGESNWLFQC